MYFVPFSDETRAIHKNYSHKHKSQGAEEDYRQWDVYVCMRVTSLLVPGHTAGTNVGTVHIGAYNE